MMETYKLTKEPTGKVMKNGTPEYLYKVTCRGIVLSEFKSVRNYVACTIDGLFRFGKVEFIGKADHGRRIRDLEYWFERPREAYINACNFLKRPEHLRTPADYGNFLTAHIASYTDRLKRINTIAYL